jgi:predicted dehydrogenase
MTPLSRRRLIGGAAASNLLLAGSSTVFGSQANSKVTFGIIGTGGRGRYVGKIMSEDPNAQLVAICDLYPERLDLAKTHIPAAASAQSYKDLHELLARKDIDAVLIATPVFLHPEHFEAAARAGKHIYCEKPAGASVAGVLRMQKAAEAMDKSKTVAFGFQQRWSPEYLEVERMIRNGDLGDLTPMISFWIYGNSVFRKAEQPPLPWDEERIRHWGNYRETSGDIIVEQDCHGVDILNWYSQAHPLKAFGDGGRKARTYGDNMDHVNVTYEYPGGLKGWLIASQLPPRGYWDVKEQFFGTKASVEVARGYYAWTQAGNRTPFRKESKREITIDAVAKFFESIAAGKPYSMAKDAVESTLTSLLGRLAIDKRREVTWDELLKSA